MKRKIINIFIRIMVLLLLSKALFYMAIVFFWGLMLTNDITKDVFESMSEIVLIIICAYLLLINAFAIFGKKRKHSYSNKVVISFVLIAVLFSVVVQIYNLFTTTIPYSIAHHHYVDVLIPHIIIIVSGSYFAGMLLVIINSHKAKLHKES